MIFFTAPYPISANRYWGTRVMNTKGQYGKPGRPMVMTYVTKEAESYKRLVRQAWADAGHAHQITGRVSVAIHLYPHRPLDFKARMRKLGEGWDDTVQCIDLDNANKVLLDALKGLAFEDDKWVRQLQSERQEPDNEGARVEIWIRRMGSGAPRQKSLSLITTMETA